MRTWHILYRHKVMDLVVELDDDVKVLIVAERWHRGGEHADLISARDETNMEEMTAHLGVGCWVSTRYFLSPLLFVS